MSVLADEARRLLAERPRSLTYKEIGNDIGVSVRWLENFAADKMPNASISKVEALFNRLSYKSVKAFIQSI